MIRRDVRLVDGRPGWLFIPQREHARLSHFLASAWRDLLAGAPSGVREEFLAALLHHDDGWTEWWESPSVDPELGAPYAFTEMPSAEAQVIWLASIEACRGIGPLAGWTVASHFATLQGKRDDDYHEWVDWIGRQQARANKSLDEWLAQSDGHTKDLAEECLRQLQAFDWMSLWLCCKSGVGDDPLQIGEGDRATRFLAPQSERFPFAATSVSVDPWPFTEKQLTIELQGRVAPAERLVDPNRFEEFGETISVSWRLSPRSPS